MNGFFLQAKDLFLSKTVKDTSVVFVGNLVSSILAILFTILAAKVLGPENWGLIAGVGSFVSILIAVSDLGIGAALINFFSRAVAESTQKAKAVASSLFVARTILVTGVFILVVLFSRFFSGLVFKSTDTNLVIFSAIAFAGFSFLDFQISLSQAKRRWFLSSTFISLPNILRFLGLIVLIATKSVSFLNILFVFGALPFIAWIVSLAFEGAKITFTKETVKTIKKSYSFSFWMWIGKLVSTFSSRVDVILLISLSGAYTAGIYSAASRLAFGIPLVVASFARVLAPKFSSMQKEKLSDYFRKTIGLSVLLTLGVIAGIFISPYIISLFGDKYSESTRILQLMLASFIPFVLSTPAVNLLVYAFEKPKILTLIGILELPVVLAINVFLIPIIGVTAPILALFVTNLTTAVLTYYFSFVYLKKA